MEIKDQVKGLARWDTPQFLASEWNHIYGIMAGNPNEAERLIRWWVDALSLEPSKPPEFNPNQHHLRAFINEHSEFYTENLEVLANHIRAGNRELRSRWRWVARGYGYELGRLADHWESTRKLDQLNEPNVGDRKLKYLSESIKADPDELEFGDIERNTKREIARRELANKLLTTSKEAEGESGDVEEV